MSKKIQFIEYNEQAKYCKVPQPSNSFIPEWFKKMDTLIQGNKRRGLLNNIETPNTTMKSCSPFLDALTTGYIWSAEADIEIKTIDDSVFFNWRIETELVSEHSKDQHPILPPAFNGYDFVMKWAFHHIIKTPPGYSTFFTHPLNRNDLPFRTFSGIVDTDSYILPVQFPFQLMATNDFPIIIEKGTPLCQFFPFKRDNWSSEKISFNYENYKKTKIEYFSKIQKAYKSRYWNKKQYK